MSEGENAFHSFEKSPENETKSTSDDSKLVELFKQKQIMMMTVAYALLCVVTYVLFGPVTSSVIFSSYICGLMIVYSLCWLGVHKFFLINSRCLMAGHPVPRRSSQSFHIQDHDDNPWECLTLTADVDRALEEFLDLCFEKYIFIWYRDITDDGGFLCELKTCIRYAVASLLQRATKINLTELLTGKFLKVCLCHVDACVQARHCKGSIKRNLEEAFFDYYGADLHVAVYSRSTELQYLHGLSESILPIILPAKSLQCKSYMHLIQEVFSSSILLVIMDTIADPDIINYLLLLLFNNTPMRRYPPSTEPLVPVLQNFAQRPSRSETWLGENSMTPMQATYLYLLMKFMKQEGCVGILQFCLAIDEFSAQLLNPDLRLEDIRALHSEARNLYVTFMAPEAVDRLNIKPEIAKEFKAIVDGPYDGVLQLQTTEPLYEAHEYAFRILESHLERFYESEEYFEFLCGPRRAHLNPALVKPGKNASLSTSAKIRNKINKIRGVLRPVSAIDGQLEDSSDLADAGFEAEEIKLAMGIDPNDVYMDDTNFRDLSAWRVSIPRVESRRDTNHKLFFVFLIDVQRIDVSDKDNPDEFHWTVERQYLEFYVLETKLTEFHGEFVDIHLPTRRSFGTKGLEYMESRRAAFEEFLQRLLQKPTFRGSELLFTFLTSTGDFTKGLLLDINLGRMIKNVPMKLLKEKGQHLESFLQNFMTSAEPVKPKPSQEFLDVFMYQTSAAVRRLHKSIYGDNAGRRLDHSPSSKPRFNSVLSQNGLCDCVFYIALKVLQLPRWPFQLLVSVLYGFGSIIESYVTWYIELNLREALVPQRYVFFIHLLRDAMFFKEPSHRTDEDKRARANEALIRMKSCISPGLAKILGRERYNRGLELLFTFLQCSRINKQLGYTLLDCIVAELFPELTSVSGQASCHGGHFEKQEELDVRCRLPTDV